MKDSASPSGPVYKILTKEQWSTRGKNLPWAPLDHTDGYIHLSTGDQLEETLRLHFSGQPNLVIAAIDPALIPTLKWEPSRGGQLFPHAYGEVPLTAVVGVQERDSVTSA